MYRSTVILVFSVVIAMCVSGCDKDPVKTKAQADYVADRLDSFSPVKLEYKPGMLDERETAAMKKIIRASQYMDEIFLRQVYSRNPEIRAALRAADDPAIEPYRELFNIMFGPFDRLNEDKPFIGSEPKPDGANYYPADTTREEFTAWIKAHPEDKEAFQSPFTLIRRKNNGLVAIPYSKAYKEWLEPAAQLLREAAQLTANESLAKYLNLRADAFASNDYYESDCAWLELDSKIEVVIGPYEVYEDALFGYKAGFESFVTIVDEDESEKLERVARHLDELESALPMPDEYRTLDRGETSPVKVVHEVFTAGDTKAGVQTTAFILPNDERVRAEKGSKKVMLKNIARAKFDNFFTPVAKIVLDESSLSRVSFDRWFTHILMHEFTHGLGPGNITLPDGTRTTVTMMLRETGSAIEECKADVGGLYTYAYLCNQGVFPEEQEDGIYATFLAGIFRSARFGTEEAHGQANMIAFNYIMEKGGFVYDEATEKYSVNQAKIRDAVRDLLSELLLIQAKGDYDEAKRLTQRYGHMPEMMEKTIEKFEKLPIDIKPVYQVLEKL